MRLNDILLNQVNTAYDSIQYGFCGFGFSTVAQQNAPSLNPAQVGFGEDPDI